MGATQLCAVGAVPVHFPWPPMYIPISIALFSSYWKRGPPKSPYDSQKLNKDKIYKGNIYQLTLHGFDCAPDWTAHIVEGRGHSFLGFK